MKTRALGQTDMRVSSLGLGLMSLSGVYGEANDSDSIKLIHYALDQGINLLDSADMYGWGHNETLLGKALKGRRGEAIVATKFGQGRLEDGTRTVNGRPEYVREACEASLKRLGVDVIDLYYLHRVDPATPIEETVGAMKRLVEEGKVRALGLSEVRAETVRRAQKIHPIAAVQNEYSLLYRKEGEETRVATREHGITLVAYGPLGRSMLTGTVRQQDDLPHDDPRLQLPRFQAGAIDQNLALAGKLERIAEEKNCTPAQLALAWLLAQGDDIVPIPGTKRKERVDENIKASLIELGPEDLQRISDAAPLGAGAGARYPAEAMHQLYL